MDKEHRQDKNVQKWLQEFGMNVKPGRLASDPWTIKGTIPIPDGVEIQSPTGRISQGHTPITVTFKANRDDLARLYSFSQAAPEAFFLTITGGFLAPVFAASISLKGKRGRFKGLDTILNWTRTEACEVYYLLKHLLESGRRPKFFLAFLDHVLTGNEDDDRPYYTETKKGERKLNPIALTAAYLEGSFKYMRIDPEEVGIISYSKRIEQGDTGYDSSLFQDIILTTPRRILYEHLSDAKLEQVVQTPLFIFLTYLARESGISSDCVPSQDKEHRKTVQFDTSGGERTPAEKMVLVLRSIRGETYESISQQSGACEEDLATWERLFLAGGKAALKNPKLIDRSERQDHQHPSETENRPE